MTTEKLVAHPWLPAAPRPARRAVLAACAGGLLALRPRAGLATVPTEWPAFRQRFVTPEGRVLDTGNGNISHSEGQGAALLFAVRADDRATFERVLSWTRTVLRRPTDALLAWRYRPGTATPVSDLNNATDGDLMVAWALTEAAERWGAAQHRALAVQMGRDLLRRVVLSQGDEIVLLPGAEGFFRPDHLVLNPSYYVIPAFRALDRVLPSPHWRALEESGVALASRARFGRWRLPPDWVTLPRGAGRPGLAAGWPPRFSYDAVRVPLYLAWGGRTDGAALRSAVEFWSDPAHASPPAWADLRTNAIAPYGGDAGQRAVERLAQASLYGSGRAALLPRVAGAPHYYAASLVMMSQLAWRDLSVPEPGNPGSSPSTAGASSQPWLLSLLSPGRR
ncbi:glycosyl hydrolase family 8 [Muricoccus pecuniae]|uniref:cellulase n=1 Tax=Muricoccus pecuniae TaxID=693023 RepID=A0A840YEK7_9PROT|nr:glycosyl hydrolase family 8 [Roseomonas pecuniae]MBB5692313.1 endoglucanase [Roseomonas pecuniae]